MEYAVFFDNGGWIVLLEGKFGQAQQIGIARPTLEEAIMELSLHTGAPVGIKLIAPPP